MDSTIRNVLPGEETAADERRTDDQEAHLAQRQSEDRRAKFHHQRQPPR
jgi:hypothetical protein